MLRVVVPSSCVDIEGRLRVPLIGLHRRVVCRRRCPIRIWVMRGIRIMSWWHRIPLSVR